MGNIALACRIFVPVVGLVLVAGLAGAQQAGGDDGGDSALRMRESVSRALGSAQSCVEEGDFECARRRLETLRERDGLYAYEEALMWRFYAYIAFEEGDLPAATAAYERLLAVAEVPSGLEQESSLTLAQLYAQQERFADALEMLQRWFALVPEPGPDQLYLKAQLSFQLERYAGAIQPLERAIALAESRGREPNESWHNLLRVLYFETGDESRLHDVLRTLVENWPRKEYVTHLASLYGQRGEDQAQLALVEAAYSAGWLSAGSELVSYASMLLAAGIPYKAARVLEDGLDAGTIEPTLESWRLLGQAWSLAREDRRALPALNEAARLAEDGRIFLQLASAHANLAQPQQCVDAARSAVERGLERPAEANIVLGSCLADLRRFDAAQAVLEAAARDAEARELARDFLRYVESERELERRLNEALADSGVSPEP